MATKKICDRCGAEINPKESMTILEPRDFRRNPLCDKVAKELCVSCALHLRKWLKGDAIGNIHDNPELLEEEPT